MSPKKSQRPAHNRSAIAALNAPITITITGNTAAALRFEAFTQATTPQEAAVEAVRSMLACSLTGRMTDDDAAAWLGDQEPAD